MNLNEILKKYGFNDFESFISNVSGLAVLAVNEIIKNYKTHEFVTNEVLLKSHKLKDFTLVLIAMISDSNEIESYAVGRRYDDFEKKAFIDYFESGTYFYSLNEALAFFEQKVIF